MGLPCCGLVQPLKCRPPTWSPNQCASYDMVIVKMVVNNVYVLTVYYPKHIVQYWVTVVAMYLLLHLYKGKGTIGCCCLFVFQCCQLLTMSSKCSTVGKCAVAWWTTVIGMIAIVHSTPTKTSKDWSLKRSISKFLLCVCHTRSNQQWLCSLWLSICERLWQSTPSFWGYNCLLVPPPLSAS